MVVLKFLQIFGLTGTTDARVACFLFLLGHFQTNEYELLLITREWLGLATWDFDSSLSL